MKKIAIIGLGYVGLPLAVEFGKKRPVLGFDINSSRIEKLKEGYDQTLEVSREELIASKKLDFSCDGKDLSGCDIYIVTVPTPINAFKQPDLKPLKSATSLIANYIKEGDIVIYESTVYPGCTEEDCVPIIEEISGLKYNRDFYCGYSPERINPGDKKHRLTDIKKVTSGSTDEVSLEIDKLYQEIITAGTYRASSIKVAEAAKVIENSQRDLNIAFVNELSLIFDRLNIDTYEVIEAAETKWNFLPFKPGLVGGHCIGVDPYYLTHKAESIGYHPEVILSGRRINDNMPFHVASKLIKRLLNKKIQVNGAKILVLGVTFKENCPDIRNSKVVDLVKELKSYGTKIDIFDPNVLSSNLQSEYGLELVSQPTGEYDAIVLAVAHNDFKKFEISKFKKSDTVVFDLKAFWENEKVDERL